MLYDIYIACHVRIKYTAVLHALVDVELGYKY